MHLRNVELFCDVVTRGSFSKAAEANNVSQPSASQAVHALEKRLGTLLIDRSKRPLQLTSAGQVYFDGCQSLLESFREIEDRVQRLENKVTGRMRVAAIYSVGLLQMDGCIERFQERYPEVDLSVDFLHPDEVYARILNHDADLGLVSFPRDGGEIHSIPWQKQPMVFVVSPQHRLADCRVVVANQLDGECFVGFESELTIRKQIDRWLKRARVTVKMVHQFDNIENIKRAVEIDAGVSILPVPTVRRETEFGSLMAIPFDDVDWFRPLGVIHKRHKTLTTAAVKFVDLLKEVPEAFPETQLPSSKSNGNQTTKSRTGGDPKDRLCVAPESHL